MEDINKLNHNFLVEKMLFIGKFEEVFENYENKSEFLIEVRDTIYDYIDNKEEFNTIWEEVDSTMIQRMLITNMISNIKDEKTFNKIKEKIKNAFKEEFKI